MMNDREKIIKLQAAELKRKDKRIEDLSWRSAILHGKLQSSRKGETRLLKELKSNKMKIEGLELQVKSHQLNEKELRKEVQGLRRKLQSTLKRRDLDVGRLQHELSLRDATLLDRNESIKFLQRHRNDLQRRAKKGHKILDLLLTAIHEKDQALKRGHHGGPEFKKMGKAFGVAKNYVDDNNFD